MKDGFIRAAAATPRTAVGDTGFNTAEIEKYIREAAEKKCALAVFPELSITAYSCGDLFRQRLLTESAEKALTELMDRTSMLDIVCVAGIPAAFSGRLYNCGAVFHRGRLLGLAAKSVLSPAESRFFSPGMPCAEIEYCGQSTFIGTGLLFSCQNIPALTLAALPGGDVFSAIAAGNAVISAAVIAEPAAAEELAGKREYIEDLLRIQSAETISGCIYASAGAGESTTDMVYAGQNIISENGKLLAQSELFSTGLTVAELDLQLINQERIRVKAMEDMAISAVKLISFAYKEETVNAFEPERKSGKFPFVPAEPEARERRCRDLLAIQSAGLEKRLSHIGCDTVLLGVSGGLDSTLALLVIVKAFDNLGLSRKGIYAVSMPCFGTTDRTRKNAVDISEGLGVQFLEIPIGETVLRHFKDIGQDAENHDTAYENAQARERTQVLMDMANQKNGIVIGTGDLSELALGWATYNGDHMAMYGVNASIPKTLVRFLVEYTAENSGQRLKQALRDVLDTPVSPELLPPVDGVIAQKTEDIVGSYALHDFFLYYMVRFGFTPGKIYRMACRSFAGDFEPQEIKKWIGVFYRRFFSQQFKRSCLPDSPKVGTVSLSPRGDYIMPSDASAALWIKEIESL